MAMINIDALGEFELSNDMINMLIEDEDLARAMNSPGFFSDDEYFEPEVEDLNSDQGQTQSPDGTPDDVDSVHPSASGVRTILGRTYISPNENRYIFPNDVGHRCGELFMLEATTKLTGKLFHAPLPLDGLPGTRVLDLGSGSGVWAKKFASVHTSCLVTGVDLLPSRPNTRLPNLNYEVGNFLQPWTSPWNHFGYIHMNDLIGSVPDLEAFYKVAYDHLEPGGWLEHKEIQPLVKSLVCPPVPVIQTFDELFRQLGVATGNTFHAACGDTMSQAMRRAGFVELKAEKVILPIGMWSAVEGEYNAGVACLSAVQICIEGLLLLGCCQFLGWSVDQVDKFVEDFITEVSETSKCYYLELTICVGRKPIVREDSFPSTVNSRSTAKKGIKLSYASPDSSSPTAKKRIMQTGPLLRRRVRCAAVGQAQPVCQEVF